MKRSGIVTLITDFGLRDHYVAMIKGVILSINPDAKLVDITHSIRAGSILHAAGLIRETFPYFPKGTVHVAVVDPGVGSERRVIGIEASGHLFVGPDNGIFWPVIEGYKAPRIVHLTRGSYFLEHITYTFHGREVFAPVAAHLSKGSNLRLMGSPIKDPVKLDSPLPRKIGEILYGQIMRIDNFGNLITNIYRKELEVFLESAKPVVTIGNLEIKELNHIYAEADKGEPLALINSSDLLEVAVNLGRASEYIGLHSEEIIGASVKVGKLR